MISNHTKNSFIIIYGLLWEEFNNNSSLRFWWNNSFNFGKGKYIWFISKKLKTCRLITIIDYIQQSISRLSKLHLPKMNRFSRKLNFNSIRLPSRGNFDFISPQDIYRKSSISNQSSSFWLKCNRYVLRPIRGYLSLVTIQNNWCVLPIIIDSNYFIFSFYLRVVS